MKKRTQRMISKVLVAVIMATTIGTSPPPVLASLVNEKMLEAMKDLASPSEATALETVATPSEAEKPDGKASPSEAVKKFVKLEPDEVPEYYSQVSALGKKFWKFKDRNGTIQYRDYGYIQGDTEFPLWYEADSQGKASENSINEDEEYYELAPYLYKSAAPTKASWSDLSWKLLNDSESIFLFNREESESFKNWDSSTYDIWSVNGLLESEEEIEEEIQNTDLGYFFYGQIANERDSENEWYYADSKGTVWSMSNMLKASLLASSDSYTWYMDAPGDIWSTIGNKVKFSGKKVIGGLYDRRVITDFQKEKGLDFHSKFVGWSNIRSHDNSIWYNNTFGFMTGDPAKTSSYTNGGTLFSKSYEIDPDRYYIKNYYGIWCPENADMYIFASDNTNMHEANHYFDIQNVSYDTTCIIVKRNESFDVSLAPKPSKEGWTFEGWDYYGNAGNILKDGDTLYCGSSGKVKWIFPVFTPRINTVTFLDNDGNLLKEEQVQSGNSATAPIPPEIPGKIFNGWDTAYNYVRSDITVKAQYKDTVTLTIVGNGGTVYGQDTYVTELPINTYLSDVLTEAGKNAVREGYNTHTVHWYYLNEDGTKSTYFPTSIKENITAYVDWQINKYTVTFEDIYSEPKVTKKITVEHGTLFKDLDFPTFVPWKSSSSYGAVYEFGGFVSNKSNDNYVDPDTPIVGNTTFYVKWKPIIAKVNWHSCMPDGDVVTQSEFTVVNYLSYAKLGSPDLKRTGYRNVSTTYWYSEPGGKGEILSNDLLLRERNLDLYAYWKPLDYTIYCYRNLNSSDTTRTIINHTYDLNDAELPTQEPPSGKVFIGYSTSRNGTDIYKSIHELPYNSSSIYVYAQYANEKSKITFKDWDGTVISEQEVGYHEPILYPEDPVREDYKFTGWDRQLGEVSNLTGDTVVKAQYKLAFYNLTLDMQSGTLDGKTSVTLKVEPGSSIDSILSDSETRAIRKGHVFDGWYNSTSTYSGVKYPDSENIMPEKDLTIYARWIREAYFVTFKDWDGTVLKEQEVPVNGGTVTAPPMPERDEYEFMGWDRNFDKVTSDLVINAKYTALKDLSDGFSVYFNQYGYNGAQVKYETALGTEFDTYSKLAYVHRTENGRIINNSPMYDLDTTYYNSKNYRRIIEFPREENDANNYFLGWTTHGLSDRYTEYQSKGKYANGVQWRCSDYQSTQNIQLESERTNVLPGFPLYNAKDKASVQELIGNDYPLKNNLSINNGTGSIRITGIYLPKNKGSLVLVNGMKNSYSTFYEDYNWDHIKTGEDNTTTLFQENTPFLESIVVEDFGEKINIFPLSEEYYDHYYYEFLSAEKSHYLMREMNFSPIPADWYDTHILLGYFEKPNGMGKPLLGNYTFNKVDDRYYAYWVDKDATVDVVYKDANGNVIGNETIGAGDKCSSVPAGPTKPGYIFIGWEPVDTENSSSPDKTIKDTTYIPKYEKAPVTSYKLVLKGNGGTIDDKDSQENDVEEHSNIDDVLSEMSEKIKKEYHTFAGWYTAPSGGSKYPESGNLMPDTDLTVYAQWKRSTSAVTFKDWNGATLDSQEVAIGEAAVPPEAPERVGYTFAGWDKPYTNIQDHTTITARYTANSYKLTLDGNGGTVDGSALKELNYDFEDSFDQALSDGKEKASRKYYTFAGWYTTSDEGSKYLESGNKMPDKNLTVYAHWVRGSSEVIFKDWTGTVIEKQEVAIGADAAPPEAPERAGYTFAGWHKPYTNIQDHIIITARYTINSYKLTLDGNGGTLEGKETKVQTFDFGNSVDQALTDGKKEAARRFYTFTGWFTSTSEGSKYPESGNLMPDTDLTVFAQWKRSSSEVIFKDWDGTVLETQEIAIGADATPPEVPDRPGYTFAGWDKPYTDIQDHRNITAQYTINGYKLTLDGNGGTIDGNVRKDQVLSFNQSFDQVLKDGRDLISRPGYSFDGWYTSATGGSSYLYSGNFMPAINVTVFAHWTPNTYKITFDPDHVRWAGGVTTEEHTFDTRLGALPAPEIYGWKFAGWWTEKNGTGTEVTNDFMIEPKDAVYYGSWEPETYQIPFISKVEQPEGESVQTFTVGLRYDQPFGKLPVPEENGYTFTGWYDEGNQRVDSQTIFDADTEAEGSAYHAGWKANTYKYHFSYNDADGKPVIREIEATYGTQYGTLPTPEKPGYTFIGWFKENGEEVTAESWVVPGETEFKARWRANQYTIQFERNLSESEVIENPKDKTVTYGFPIGELPVLKESGYLFLGWYTEPSGGTRIKETTFAALGDQTYYAHWVTDWIDHGDGTYRRPGADGKWNTPDDEVWWKGPDGISGTQDDKVIQVIPGGGYYVDNGDGTNTRPGNGGSWKPGETEHWWNGPDGIPGTKDDHKKDGNGSTDPEPTKPEPSKPTEPEPSKPTEPEPSKPTEPEPSKPTKPEPSKPTEPEPSKPTKPEPSKPTEPEPLKPEPSKESNNDREDSKEIINPSVQPSIDTALKPNVPDNGGTFKVNPEDPLDVTYTNPDGTPASNEWIGDGTDYYHVNEDSKLDYDWFLEEDGTWYMLNNKPGEKFGAALRNWYGESMDRKQYFFDPGTTKMLTGWQRIDDKWYFFTPRNEGQTYFGSNRTKWKYDPLRPGKPYGSMYQNEYTPDGYWVDEHGVSVNKK
ncbi:InlB B-repeat-containing protein [Lacrimispora sp.]|uniref:InlB B-repeat-containing protein n=1 Tax=Lacrimispora sp. TaxID=2719234 RepID=UPI0039917191